MSERFGKLASPMASGGLGGGSEEWTQVESVVPSSWVRLLEVKSQFYQAQVNHRLAQTLIYLALHGKPPPESSEDQEPLGPLPVEGLYSDDGFLESQVSSHLGTFTHSAHFSIDKGVLTRPNIIKYLSSSWHVEQIFYLVTRPRQVN